MTVTDVSVSVDTHGIAEKCIWEHVCSWVCRLAINLNMWHCNLLKLPAQSILTTHHFHILCVFSLYFSLPLLFSASLTVLYTLPTDTLMPFFIIEIDAVPNAIIGRRLNG